MKKEHKNLTPIEKTLLTWYQPDNSKYKDPLHPTLKLAGEIGELLDLYAKHLFKPDFDWMNCKHCGMELEDHSYNNFCSWGYAWENNLIYTSMVLNELGDIWYYLRILAWIYDIELLLPNKLQSVKNIDCIKEMYYHSSSLLTTDLYRPQLHVIYNYLTIILNNLNYTLDQLTELNYQKLNSEETNHGWKDAT